MIKAVILDFDDTLCLTQIQSLHLQNEVMKKMGRPEIDPAIHKKTWGMILSESMPLRSPGIKYNEFKKVFDQTMQDHVSEGKIDIVPPENLETLEKLIKQGKQISIITSRTYNEVRHLLEDRHHLSKYITNFYHKDNTDFHKPDPKVFSPFFSKEKFKPSECVYVGDSIGDAVASSAAGIRFIASLESGLKTEEDFDGQAVDCFINKFTELPDAVSALETQ